MLTMELLVMAISQYSSWKQFFSHAETIMEIFSYPLMLKCIWHEIFYQLIWKSFQSDEEWSLFYCDSILVCRVIQDFSLCKLVACDVTLWNQNDVKKQNMEILSANTELIGFKFCRVDVLQELHILIIVMLSPQQHSHYQTSTFLK